MNRFAARHAASVLVVLLATGTAGCFTARGTVGDRASQEIPCPRDRIELVPRPELTSKTYDARGCGRVLRYTCDKYMRSWHTPACVREPAPSP